MNNIILQFGKDSLVYGIGSVINRFIGLLMLPLFTSYLNPDEYGILAMLALMTMVVHPIFSLGLSAAMGAFYFEKPNPKTKGEVVYTVCFINVICAFILLILAWSFSEFICDILNIERSYSNLVGLSLTGTSLLIISTAFMQKIQFEKKPLTYVGITLSSAFAAIIISLFTITMLHWGVFGMVLGQLIGNFMSFLCFFIFGTKDISPSLNKKLIPELLNLGLPMVPSLGFILIIMHFNKYILQVFSDLHTVGVYSIGFNLGMALSILTSGITTAWYPFFMEYINKQDEAKKVFPKVVKYYIYIVGIICIAFFIFAKPIVYILTAQPYHEAWLVVGFIAAANFISTIFNFLLPGVYFHKEIKILPLIQGATVIILIPITFLFINHFNMLGAAISVMFGNILMVLLMYLWNQYRGRNIYYVELEWKKIISILLCFVSIIIFYHSIPKNLIVY